MKYPTPEQIARIAVECGFVQYGKPFRSNYNAHSNAVQAFAKRMIEIGSFSPDCEKHKNPLILDIT